MAPVTGVVLLDLDGVLVDSRAVVTGAMRRALAEHGLGPCDAATLEGLIGPPLLGAVGALLGADPAGPLVTSRAPTPTAWRRSARRGASGARRSSRRRAPTPCVPRPRRCRRWPCG